MNLKEIKLDIQSFADDDADVVIERNGSILFTKNGEDILIKIREDLNTGTLFVKVNETEIPYRKYLSKHLGKLDLFATKIREKRKSIDLYIDGDSTLISVSNNQEGTGLDLINHEASNFLFSGTKLTFITADAGHGKTALLKEYQSQQANKYLKGETNFLFWHVDLQGRELVRLNEALMYDLGELRIPGLYYSSILTLIKRKFIVLAIDGFDELAAEIGGSIALGALSSLVSQMDNSGTIIAASRRTFFDTQDYIKRTKILKGTISSECEFNEIKLQNWSIKEAVNFMSFHYDKPKKIYSELLTELNNDANHPILTRPFLLTKVIESMVYLGKSPAEFVGQLSDPLEGVAAVVEAFTEREVSKWKLRDKDTGTPYLSYQQHVELLSMIAQEMWDSKNDKISVEEVQFITTLLCEEWKINSNILPQVISMVKSHALLIPPNNFQAEFRKFEHEEFRYYFLAKSLSKELKEVSDNNQNYLKLKKFLYIAQLPDSIAQYASKQTNSQELNVLSILNIFQKIINEEWKPTYLQTNIGTLIPYLLNEFKPKKQLIFDSKVNFTSIIFENKILANLLFKNSNFINISFRNTLLANVVFEDCTFNEVRIETNSENAFQNCSIINCKIDSIILYTGGYIMDSVYAPGRIKETLTKKLGFKVQTENQAKSASVKNEHFKKCVTKFLNHFNNKTLQYEMNIKEDGYYSKDRSLILDVIIPILAEHQIIEKKETKYAKQRNTTAWGLATDLDLDLIFSSDKDVEDISKVTEDFLIRFWETVNNYE